MSKVEFDPFGDDYFNDPSDVYRRLRDEAPVYFSEKYGFYALSRFADVLAAQERSDEAGTQLASARLGFEELLEKHPLAFADHAAEFYAGSGNDCRRALTLARMNVANRPTRRAVKQADAIAASCS